MSFYFQISRDEIAMLEHDLKRLKIENAGLRNSLEKAEMLVSLVWPDL